MSTECAYQAAKVDVLNNPIGTVEKISNMAPGEAKRFARRIKLRPDWDDVKVDIMLDLQRQKYKNPKLRQQLLDTGNAYIEETNTWGDKFWGVCNGIGRNELGFILMKVREEIRDGNHP